MKEYQRSPIVTQTRSRVESQALRSGDLKDQKEILLIESAVQAQKSSLYQTKQIIGEFKAFLLEKFSKCLIQLKQTPLYISHFS